MSELDKEFERLSNLQQELYAMKQLKADEDIIKKQERKIINQEKKMEKLIGGK